MRGGENIMAYSNEKMYVLEMLEKGKITSEEAARLIEALDGDKENKDFDFSFFKDSNKADFQGEVSKLGDRINNWIKDIKATYIQKDFDKSIDEFSSKIENIASAFTNTTTEVADKIADFVSNFIDNTTFNFFGSYKTIDKEYRTSAIEGIELDIHAVNGYITLKKHLENEIIVNSKIRCPQNDDQDYLTIINKNNQISINLTTTKNISISHEIYIPSMMFKKIRLETSNAKIYVEDIVSQDFEALTTNCDIELMGINCNNLYSKTKNAKIQIGYTTAKDIDISTINSSINIKHVKVGNLNASSNNGKIFIEDIHNYYETSMINIQVKTKNSGIKIDMNDMENKGYKIDAKTTNANIDILIPDMTYTTVDKELNENYVKAQSKNFSLFKKMVTINAETKNGNIEIIK